MANLSQQVRPLSDEELLALQLQSGAMYAPLQHSPQPQGLPSTPASAFLELITGLAGRREPDPTGLGNQSRHFSQSGDPIEFVDGNLYNVATGEPYDLAADLMQDPTGLIPGAGVTRQAGRRALAAASQQAAARMPSQLYSVTGPAGRANSAEAALQALRGGGARLTPDVNFTMPRADTFMPPTPITAQNFRMGPGSAPQYTGPLRPTPSGPRALPEPAPQLGPTQGPMPGADYIDPGVLRYLDDLGVRFGERPFRNSLALAGAVGSGIAGGNYLASTADNPEPTSVEQVLRNVGTNLRNLPSEAQRIATGVPAEQNYIVPAAERERAREDSRTAEMNELLERNQELERQLAQRQGQLSPYTLDLNQIFADETAENRAVREQLMALLTPQERERTTGDSIAGIGRALSAASLGGLGQDVSSIFREEDAFDERLSPRDQAMINLLAPQATNTQQSQRALQLAQALANLQLTQAQAGAVSALADQRNQPDLIQQMMAERQQRQLVD